MAEDQRMKRNWNWTKTLLVVSLALNLAVAGIVAGSAFAHKRGDRPEMGFGGGLRPYVASLPDSQRQHVRDRLLRNREAIRAARQELRQSEQAVRAAMTAAPFDANALNAAFAAQRSVYDGIAANGHHALVEVLAGMSDAERSQFIDRLKSYKRKPGSGRPEN
jgi:uncharacterized membrane protein